MGTIVTENPILILKYLDANYWTFLYCKMAFVTVANENSTKQILYATLFIHEKKCATQKYI